MAERRIDVLFAEDPSNIAWITGYDGWSFYTHQGVVVFHDRDPIWWGCRMDANFISHEDRYVQPTTCHPMEDLAARLRDWGLETTETIVIRPEGPAEALADFTRKLFVKD